MVTILAKSDDMVLWTRSGAIGNFNQNEKILIRTGVMTIPAGHLRARGEKPESIKFCIDACVSYP